MVEDKVGQDNYLWVQNCTLMLSFGFLPLLWFFLDYFSVASGFVLNPPQNYLKTTKDYADLASKIWAAVLTALYFLVKRGP